MSPDYKHLNLTPRHVLGYRVNISEKCFSSEIIHDDTHLLYVSDLQVVKVVTSKPAVKVMNEGKMIPGGRRHSGAA